MGDSRQTPIPQDRVDENVDRAQLAADDQRRAAEEERYLQDEGVDERPGTKVRQRPATPDQPDRGPAEGGD